MSILYGAFAVIFVFEVFMTYWPWPVRTTHQFIFTLGLSLAWALSMLGLGVKDDLFLTFAIAGIVWVIHPCFRFVRAWADRVEAANLLPLHRGR